MFQAQRLAFYSCLSPTHMGAGSAVGVIDQPIQREVHTQHPMLAGSGIKGALRHHLAHLWHDERQNGRIARIFGPTRDASDHAGAIAFTDAQLVGFPVRSLRHAFVHVTCQTALARLKRLAGRAASWTVPAAPHAGQALVVQAASAGAAAADGRLVLEAFDFAAQPSDELRVVADWLAERAYPPGEENDYFRAKLRGDLAMLDDQSFGHFVRHATLVEAHVRIDDETGTASEGGLFYTENLPPESLLAGLVLASAERSKAKASGNGATAPLDAHAVLRAVLDGNAEHPGLRGGVLQIGGDATTGRGLIMLNALEAT